MIKAHFLVGMLSLVSCSKAPPPEQPLKLTLELARPAIKAGERVWYRLQMTNLGSEPVAIDDEFWLDQSLLDHNTNSVGSGTYLKVYGPDGKLRRPGFEFDWGMHGEFRFWENDRDQGPPKNPPYLAERIVQFFWNITPVWLHYTDSFSWLYLKVERKTRRSRVEILPGQTVTAAPSKVAPIRRPDPRTLGVEDARIHPDVPPGQRKDYEALLKLQKDFVEGWGHPDIVLDPEKPHVLPHPGFRILEGYFFRRPGVYRIQAVHDTRTPLPPMNAEEDIEHHRRRHWMTISPEDEKYYRGEWAKKSPEKIGRIMAERNGILREDKNRQFVESDVVLLEVHP